MMMEQNVQSLDALDASMQDQVALPEMDFRREVFVASEWVRARRGSIDETRFRYGMRGLNDAARIAILATGDTQYLEEVVNYRDERGKAYELGVAKMIVDQARAKEREKAQYAEIRTNEELVARLTAPDKYPPAVVIKMPAHYTGGRLPYNPEPKRERAKRRGRLAAYAGAAVLALGMIGGGVALSSEGSSRDSLSSSKSGTPQSAQRAPLGNGAPDYSRYPRLVRTAPHKLSATPSASAMSVVIGRGGSPWEVSEAQSAKVLDDPPTNPQIWTYDEAMPVTNPGVYSMVGDSSEHILPNTKLKLPGRKLLRRLGFFRKRK